MEIDHIALPPEAHKQKSIWEIPHTQHCSIVGTCLSLGEARLIGKKINVSCPNKEDLDAIIHSVLVQECAWGCVSEAHSYSPTSQSRRASWGRPPLVLSNRYGSLG